MARELLARPRRSSEVPAKATLASSEDEARATNRASSGIMASQITPRAIAGSRDPLVPTPEVRDKFEPMLRSKEGTERRVDVRVASVLFLVYHIAFVGRCLRETGSRAALGWKIAALFGGTYLSDLITGLLHIYLDHRRCDLGDPLDMAAYSFRYDHHALPLNFLKCSAFFPAGAANIISSITLPMSAVAHACLYYHWDKLHTVDSAFEHKLLVAFTVIIFGSLCQTTHALAHEGRFKRNATLPTLVAALQRYHIILPPHVHTCHHQNEHDVNFCIFNGWANPLLNRLAPAVFVAMRNLPGHFDVLAVPGRQSRASRHKEMDARSVLLTSVAHCEKHRACKLSR